ncbi:5879_t:CDS:2 [Funneliformis caledonium]|uniref:5879_t:CDS:1 n=1 Tax=Funneliformis caledonium TaxID=1117310 RepID=A0A9N8ZS25_9GLOM|nr:5879_t:CDS:2 [Funneliformis caledonium]
MPKNFQVKGKGILPNNINLDDEIEDDEYQKNENFGIPLSEEQIVAMLKENNTISSDEGKKIIISVTSSEALGAFDTIFDYLEQDDNQDIIDKIHLKQ